MDVEKQMPKKYEHVVRCRLSKRQRFLYDDFMSQASTKETLESGHFMSVINILMQLRKVCNHPNLFDPRPISSPFITQGICYSTASLVLSACELDPWKSVDLSIFDLINLEGRLSRYEAEVFLPNRKVNQKLIEEISSSPDPPPRPKPVKMKVNRMVQPVQKPDGRTVVVVSSSKVTCTDSHKQGSEQSSIPAQTLPQRAPTIQKLGVSSLVTSAAAVKQPSDIKVLHVIPGVTSAPNPSPQAAVIAGKQESPGSGLHNVPLSKVPEATVSSVPQLQHAPCVLSVGSKDGSAQAGHKQVQRINKGVTMDTTVTSCPVATIMQSTAVAQPKGQIFPLPVAPAATTTTGALNRAPRVFAALPVQQVAPSLISAGRSALQTTVATPIVPSAPLRMVQSNPTTTVGSPRPQLLQGCTAPGGTVQQRVVLTPQTQARLPTGEVISIAQLAALMNQSPPGQPLTLHIQGNKLALACSPIRMINPTPQQHLQMQGGIVHVIKPSGQGQVAAVTPLQTVSSAAKMIQVSRPIASPFQNRPRTPTLLVAHTASLSPAARPNIPSTNIIRAVSQTATVGCLPVGLQAVRPRQLSVPTAHLVFSSTSQLALASSSQAAVASASQAAVAFMPQVAVASTPQVAVAAVASTPQVAVASVSQAAVASVPQATLASAPQTAVASAPQAAVASAPQVAVASAPQVAVASSPQAAVASSPQAAVASVSQEAVHLPVSTKPSQPIHSASATKSSSNQTIKQIPEIQSIRQGSHFSTTSVAKPAPARTTIRVPSIPIPTPLERPQTRRITAAQQKLEKPETSPLQLSWLEKLRVQRHTERLDRLYTVTARRCAASPIYGVEVLRMCDLRGGSWSWVGAVHWLRCKPGAQPEHQTCFGRQTAAISAMIALPEKRLAQLQNIIDRFIFVVPPVEAPPISLHTCHPPPWMVHGERVLRRTLHDELSPRSAYLHRIRCNMRTQFPDLRLIQYDCGKLQTLDILLRRFKAGTHRVLIFTQMTRMLDILEQFLNFHGYIYLRLDGTTRVEQRQALMDLFNADPRIFCFILSTRSGGVGVNLTGADTVVFYDSDWNPTMDAQAQDRCHRIGQTRDVHIYRLIGERTVEENILKKANQKRMLGDVAIEGGNFTTAYFKQQTIRELFENPEEISRQEAAGVASAAQPLHGDDDGNPSRDNIFEQALGRAEDEEDTKAANLAKAEQVAELAEFSEVATEEGDDGEVREDEEPSKAEEEINALVEQLTPIERYALKLLENSLAPDADESQKARDTSNAAKKESHAARPSAFTESGNLGCADDITQSREETEEFMLRERHMQKTTDQLHSVIHSPKLDTSGIDADPAATTKVIDTSPLKYHDCSRKPSDVIEHSQKFEASTDNAQEEQVPSADYQEQMFERSSMTSLLPQQSENVEPIEENVEPIEENVEPIEENVEPIDENVEPIDENVEPIEENVTPSRHSPVEQDPGGLHVLRIAKINPIPLPISESPQSVEPKDYHEEPADIGEKSDDAVVGKDETPSCLEDEPTTIPSQLFSDTLISNSKIQDHIDSSVESLNITSSVAALDESMEFRNKLLQNECDTSVNEHPASSPGKNKLTDMETTTEEPPLKKPRIYISEDVKEHEEPAAPAADSLKGISDDVKKENGNRRGKLQILARGHRIGRRLPSGSSPVRTRSSKRVLALERLLNMPCHSRRGTFVTGRRRKAKRVERVVERSKKSKGTLSMQHHGKDMVVNQGTQHDSEKARRELCTDSIMRRQGQIMRSLRRKNIYKQKLDGEPPVKLGRQEAQSSGASKAEAASSTSSERPSSPVITRASLRLSVLCQSPTRTVPPPLKRQERARRVLSFGQKSEGSSTPGRACDASGLSPTKRVTRQAIRRRSARPSNDWD
uniref:Helicase C-terminal domain-containing protein n=1 Tax=Eptatretus burgeri TaxID=7764 RepID=A0A8C4X078_EPTBU